MKQDENKQNYTKKPTPVVGKKPNGKSQSTLMGYPLGTAHTRRQPGI
jgi:hypothetical protein